LFTAWLPPDFESGLMVIPDVDGFDCTTYLQFDILQALDKVIIVPYAPPTGSVSIDFYFQHFVYPCEEADCPEEPIE